MKKSKLLLLIILSNFQILAQHLSSQNDSAGKYKNEFGLDITGTIRFFTKLQSSSDYFYVPTYYLTYRRYMDKGNIRFGMGGEAITQELPSPYNDSTVYKSNSSSLDSRFGWEFKSDLSKRWQAHYGLDFRFSMGNEKNEANYFNGGYANGYESHFSILGLAPVLGFRFKLNERISLLTEANLSFNMIKYYKNRHFYTPVNGSPPIADELHPDTKGFYTQFSQPLAIYFVFNI